MIRVFFLFLIDEKGFTSTQLSAYDLDTPMKRTTTSAVPYSDTLATQVIVDGFTLPSSDHQEDRPSFDADGNQTLVKTSTGIWSVSYNVQNRPVRFTQGETIIECQYDSQGRRVFKKVSVAGAITLHHRYLYRGYVQIATLDMTRSGLNALWFILWDPSQPTATRPLAIQIAGTWMTYGLDLTKNVCELYRSNGTIATAYTYTPFGQATAVGTTTQPLGWSSEFMDSELDLVYYNYRHYNPQDGRWINRDPIGIQGGYNLYGFVGNKVSWIWDELGLLTIFGVPIDLGASFSVTGCVPIPIIPGLFVCIEGSYTITGTPCCNSSGQKKIAAKFVMDIGVSIQFGWGITPISFSGSPIADIPFTTKIDKCPSPSEFDLDGYIEIFGTIPGAKISATYSISDNKWTGGSSWSISMSFSIGVKGAFKAEGLGINSEYQ